MPVATPLDLTRQALDISVTERGAFRSCRRRWHLETIDNLEPIMPTIALDFGTGIHAALEAYYENTGDILETFIQWHADWYSKVEQDLRSLGSIGESALEEFWALQDLGTAMLEGYAHWAEQEDDWEVISVEGRGAEAWAESQPKVIPDAWPWTSLAYKRHPAKLDQGRVVAPILHPKGKTLAVFPGRPRLSGRIDLLVQRKGMGKKGLWIVDHKTTASAPNDRGIDFDDQITGYCYLVWRLTGMIPRGVIFNYLVKQTPKPVRINAPTKAEPEGPVSTAKDQLCTPAAYKAILLERGIMRKDGTITSEKHADCYSALLERGMKPFFQRFEVQRNAHEILNFERRLAQEYKDMRATWTSPEQHAYPNPSTWHCPSCSMAPICQAMEDGSDYAGIIESRYQQAPDRKAER